MFNRQLTSTMRSIILFLLFGFCMQPVQAQHDSITASKLIWFFKSGNINTLSAYVRSNGYNILDSSVNDKGNLFFYSREFKLNGNVIAAGFRKNKTVSELTFITGDKEKYILIKKELLKLGFQSQGLHTGKTGMTSESEDFKKGKLLIGTAVFANPDERLLYEFTLFEF